MRLWWGGASGRGRRAYGALTTALRKNENKSPGRSHAPAGIQPPIKITRPVPFRIVQPVTGSYQTGNLSQSLISLNCSWLRSFLQIKKLSDPPINQPFPQHPPLVVLRHYLSVGVRLHARVLFRSAIMLSISCTGPILHSKPPVAQRCAVRANNKANMAVRIS